MRNFNFLGLAVILLGTTLLSSCQNTIQGFGKDMQNTGQQIEQSTQK